MVISGLHVVVIARVWPHGRGRQQFARSIQVARLDQDADATYQIAVQRPNAESLLVWNQRLDAAASSTERSTAAACSHVHEAASTQS